ncbi:MAG: hypothetical protein K9G44_00915 [Melioribacteraceae bacterium]|nr:hypothetical protein [Melioribacteraceae bacterium]
MFVVKYSGPFGFIKPWTAVRDTETFSQQFLTPSILEGIEKKLFPELLEKVEDDEYKFTGVQKIKRNRLNYCGLNSQQERTWSKGGFSFTKEKGVYKTNQGIITRGVMLNPNLFLAFDEKDCSERAFTQSICLCRNEDILLPVSKEEMTLEEFELIPGFELLDASENSGFKVGYNRYKNAEEMFGDLKITGNPIRDQYA